MKKINLLLSVLALGFALNFSNLNSMIDENGQYYDPQYDYAQTDSQQIEPQQSDDQAQNPDEIDNTNYEDVYKNLQEETTNEPEGDQYYGDWDSYFYYWE